MITTIKAIPLQHKNLQYSKCISIILLHAVDVHTRHDSCWAACLHGSTSLLLLPIETDSKDKFARLV